MRVLVACEFSGTVRDAFLRKGHFAISCDLMDSDSDFGEHYKGDVEDILYVLPKNWGKKIQNTSVIDVATQYGNYGPEIICRLYDQGFRPTVYIYE